MYDQYPRRHPVDNSAIYSHSRSRTTSSNTFPAHLASPAPMHLQEPPPASMPHARRSPSVNTFSSVSSGTAVPPSAYHASPTADLQRSISSRSGNQSPQPSSYVALLRKQKATVWCDRSQYEDPRALAQARAAKMKAAVEVRGASNAQASRTSTGLGTTKVVGKIRHHNKPSATSYSLDHSNYIGVGGVPMRLSATEVEGEDSDDDAAVGSRLHHRRTGSSGRSSTSSVRRTVQYRSSGSLTQRRWSPGHTPERSGSLVQENPADAVMDDRASGKAASTGSGSSAERADAVADLGNAPRLAANSLAHSTITREKSLRTPEDLKRRGSVDERTTTLTGAGRLFIANPD